MEAKSKKPNTDPVPKTDTSKQEDRSTRRFVFWMIFISVVIVLVGGVVLYWLVNMYIEQSNKNKSQDITIGLLEDKKKDLEELKPNYEKINAPGENGKSDAQLILDAVPDSQAYDALIAMIERMAGESGGKVTTISSDTSASGSEGDGGDGNTSTSAQSYNVTVQYEGSFEQVMEFLKKSEKSARVMDFVSMSLGGSIGGDKISPSITFKVYYKTPANIEPTTEQLK